MISLSKCLSHAHFAPIRPRAPSNGPVWRSSQQLPDARSSWFQSLVTCHAKQASKSTPPATQTGVSTNPAGAASLKPHEKKKIFPKGAHARDFRVWLDREKGNKVVTRIAEVNKWILPPGREQYLKEMCKALKVKCGAGGAVKMDTWEVIIQGDHRDTVLKMLAEWGHQAKKAGG